MKLFIKNRNNDDISVLVEWVGNKNWLVFVMHGLWWCKEQLHIQEFRKVFLDNGYVVVSFDTTNTYGESSYNTQENASVTWYYNDLEDVVSWAGKQEWYEEPFVLAGHSLWGICSVLFAIKHQDKIKALAPTSCSTYKSFFMRKKDIVDEWKENWILEYIGWAGNTKTLKYEFMEDYSKYADLEEKLFKIKVPVLLIVWDEDIIAPVDTQKKIYNSLWWDKELYIIKDAPHTFKSEKDLDEVYEVFDKWIKKI